MTASKSSNQASRAQDWIRLSVPFLIFIALALFWKFTDTEQAWADGFKTVFDSFDPHNPLAFPIVMLIYIAAGYISMPLNVLILFTALFFGAFPGIPYAIAGSLLNALALYFTGRKLGAASMERLAGNMVRKVDRFLQRAGVPAVLVLRLVPVAPFTMANLACGAIGVRVRHYVIGTFLGLLPGIVLIGFTGSQLLEFLRRPDSGSAIWVLAGFILLALLIVGGRLLVRHLRRSNRFSL
ncbi:MAG: VTT domain-containing protein [Leptospiraceae bacterium]|nr:VTT domain-containing protein [Leptospiraceae bacterium]